MHIEELRRKREQQIQLIPQVVQGELLPLSGETSAEQEEQELLMEDFTEARVLLKYSLHLLDYVSNTDLLPRVGKRERIAMGKLSEKIHDYLDSVEGEYDE